MKINNIFIGVLLLTVISLSCYIYFNSRKPITENITNSKKSEILTEAKLIARKVDRKGITHTILEETNNVLPANLIDEGYSNEFVDSLLAETEIQRNQITALTRINQTVEAKNLEAVQVISNLKEKVWEYRDSNLSMSFKTDSIDNGLFGYSFNQDLDIREYTKRNWFLGKQRDMMDITSTSKFSTINKVNKLSFEKHEDPFDITTTARALYFPKTGNVGFGAQLKVRYKDFSLKGSNLYFPNTKRYVPVLEAEYRLIKF